MYTFWDKLNARLSQLYEIFTERIGPKNQKRTLNFKKPINDNLQNTKVKAKFKNRTNKLIILIEKIHPMILGVFRNDKSNTVPTKFSILELSLNLLRN